MNVSRETWPMVRLGEVCEVRGKTISNFSDLGSTPYVGLEHLNQGGGFLQVSQVDAEDPKSAKNQFESGDVLFGRLRPNLRKVALASFEGVCSTDIVVLVPSMQIEAEYLKNYLLTDTCLAQVLQRVNGINLPRISTKDLLQVAIPFPPLAEQRRIAEILEGSAGSIQRARALLEKQSSLPVQIVRNYLDRAEQLVPLKDVCKFAGGSTPSKSNGEYWNGTIPWFSSKDLKADNLSDSIDHVTSLAIEKTSLKPTVEPSIAVSLRGMSLAHSVPMSIIPQGACVNQDLKTIIPNDPRDLNLLFYSLKCREPYLLSKVSSSAHGTKKLDFNHLKEVLVPEVSQEDIERLNRMIRQTLNTRELLSRKLNLFQQLHQSLATRAFAGQL
ncbi:restriction endonuclease subunit S [Corynebacterium hindlerae]|uniref:restriction endonuclease subunit S n=1 Tax=Corynebacterium hindlerae TaxID=699041 RepID=UPI001AD6144D|nr:restriction endonuclease subunit S [Corynebacterium hindlerae]QTH59876.1 restriction endonuclease subunit S [Corynebacterium hindlerae]